MLLKQRSEILFNDIILLFTIKRM